MNIEQYLGTPYDIHNIDGLNCWGLVAAFYRDILKSSLVDFPSRSEDSREIAAVFSAAFASGEHGFHVAESQEEGDVVVMWRSTRFGKIYHCGVMVAGKVLHCSKPAGGVVYQSLAVASLGFEGVEFWRR